MEKIVRLIFCEKRTKKTWIELKNITFSRKEGIAEFSDSILQRETKQLLEMKDLLIIGS